MNIAITTADAGQLVIYGPFVSLHAMRKYMALHHPGLTFVAYQLLDSGDCMDAV